MSFNTLFYTKLYIIKNQLLTFLVENMFYKSVFGDIEEFCYRVDLSREEIDQNISIKI